jgi:hypothetical protein
MDTATALHRVELAATFFFTIPGPKMIWQFGELGYDYSINYPSGTSASRLAPKPIRWDYYTNEWRRHYVNIIFSALAGLKTTEPAFATTDFTIDAATAVKRIFLRHSTMDVVVLGNFDVINQDVVPGFTKTGMWYEFFSGDSLYVSNVDAPISFHPGEYRLYASKRLPKPQYTAINETTERPSDGTVFVYPNPSSGIFHFELNLPSSTEISIRIFNSHGQLVNTLTEAKLSRGINTVTSDVRGISPAGPGIYFYRLEGNNIHASGKLIVL